MGGWAIEFYNKKSFSMQKKIRMKENDSTKWIQLNGLGFELANEI